MILKNDFSLFVVAIQHFKIGIFLLTFLGSINSNKTQNKVIIIVN